MKKILGSLLFIPLFLFGSYEWKVTFAKEELYKDEPVLVSFDCYFSDRAPLMFIEFEPKFEGFTFEKYDFENRTGDDKRHVTYRYIAKVTKPGVYDFSVPVLMRKTTQASINETIIGRDNAKELEFTDTRIMTPSKKVVVHESGISNTVAGTFKMKSAWNKSELKPFEPLQLMVELIGEGNFKSIEPFDFNISGVTIYKSEPVIRYELGAKGYRGYTQWRYAFISDRNFTVPDRKIVYFDLSEKKVKTLHLKARHFTVAAQAHKRDELLDSVEYPSQSWDIDYRLLGWSLLSFVLGMGSLYLWQRLARRPKRKKSRRFERVEAVIAYLVANPSQAHQKLLETIETDLARKELKSVAFYARQIEKEL